MPEDPARLPDGLEIVDSFYANGVEFTVGRVGNRVFARAALTEDVLVDVWAKTGRGVDSTLRGLFGSGGLSSDAYAALVEPEGATP